MFSVRTLKRHMNVKFLPKWTLIYNIYRPTKYIEIYVVLGLVISIGLFIFMSSEFEASVKSVT